MAGIAKQLIGLNDAPESFDPADLDGDLGDDTGAGKRRRPKKTQAINLEHAGKGSKKSKMQMRQAIPVLPQYSGKKVASKEVFGSGETEVDDMRSEDGDEGEEGIDQEDGDDNTEDMVGEDDGDAVEPAPVGDLGNFSISGDLEQEYERMMKKSETELSVMRAPSAAEVAKKQAEAKQLKQKVAAWSSLVEFRIHLDGALGIAHRLPTGKVLSAVREAGGEGLCKEASAVDAEARQLLGTLLDLQHNFAKRRGIPSSRVDEVLASPAKKQHCEEADSWELVDAQMQSFMDWGIGVADEWKERTRLDTRRSFKVLDQSLSSQMRAASEVDPEKLRRRCTPPPGRHKVFCTPDQSAATAGGDEHAQEGAAEPLEEEKDIFDDREFYVQLLRESLASGDRQTGEEETRELQMELQGRRASKKRNRAEVERRASKGRKIRYTPIEKLQNFMASRPRYAKPGVDQVDPLMSEHAVDALLRSLYSSM